MSREKTRKRTGTRQFLAFLLLVAFFSSAFPAVLFTRTVMAEDPLPESNGKVYHDEEYFELYHEVDGEVASKKLEYLFAETTTPGTTRPVYCVMAGAPTPGTGSIVPAVMNDPAAAALLGRIQYIIEISTPSFSLGETVNGHPHIHYYVRQLLIWHLVYLYRDSLSASSQAYFKGIDLDSFLDGEGSGPTARQILAEAKRLWAVYDSLGRPSASGPYTPDYRAEIRDISELNFDAVSGKYYATFSVRVRETHTGAEGGTFRLTGARGGKAFIRGANGNYSVRATDAEIYSSGSAFRIEGSWKEMEPVSSAKALEAQVMALSNSGNESPQQMYGYFFDSSLTESGKSRQTYVGWYEASGKTYSGTNTSWSMETATAELTKLSAFGSMTVPEKGAVFQVYSTGYTDFERARADGLGFECVSDDAGRIVDRATGASPILPAGRFVIRQTVVPEGTKAMSPNPGVISIDPKKAKNAFTFTDEMKAGAFAIEKRIETGYDAYKGTAFSDLSPEPGAVFQVWNTKYASYEKAPSEYRDLLTTDDKGEAKSKVLPYGDYRVHQIESEATKYTYPCADQMVQIRGTSTGAPETTLQLKNKRYEQKIRIRKVNEETGDIIPAAGVEFSILDEAGNVLKDWDGKDTFVTGSDGTADLEKLGLPVGAYFIREKSAPEGFVLSEAPVRIEVKKDENFIGVGPDGDLKAVPFSDQEVSVTLELQKTGEMLTSSQKTDTGYKDLTGRSFTYTQQPLENAEFELYCREDVLDFMRDIALLDPAKYPEGTVVISEDGTTFAPYKMFDTDGDGVKETPLKKDTLLGTFLTGSDGRIVVEGLSLDASSGTAKYAFVESSAPEGYIAGSEPVVFEVKDDRQDRSVKVITCRKTVTNARKKVEMELLKKGRDYVFDKEKAEYVPLEKELAGASFGIYAESPVLSFRGDVLVEKDELIEVITSDENGLCRGMEDYPAGASFYAREIAAPKGYVLSADVFTFPVKGYAVNDASRAYLRIEKLAADTGLPMKDVEFEIYTGDGHILEKLVTGENGTAISSVAFPTGETLVLRETRTNENYALDPDQVIVISEIQKDPGEPAIQNEKIYNSRLSEISIRKVCGDGSDTPMDGVTFELWRKGGPGEPDQLIRDGKTDQDGCLRFLVGEGEYYLMETDVGRWINFRVNEEPICVICGKEGKVYHFELEDQLTKTVTEKRSAADGGLLGNCGISVRDASGRILSFRWVEEKKGYFLCAETEPGATTVLYTSNAKNSEEFGTVTIFGLPAGDYEIFEVEPPEGYRNDSEVMPVTVKNTEVLGVTRLYDTMKTSETEKVMGYGAIGICGVSAAALVSIAYIEIREKNRRKRRK